MNINRLSALVCACTLSLSLLTGCGTQPADAAADDGRLRVLTSFYPMYDFACKIGGDCIDVTNMVPSGTEPHDWEPSTNDLKNLEKADVFIYNSADMEPWADDLLVSRSDTLRVVEASENVELRTTDGEHEHAHEHEGADHHHGDFDPHVWLDPENAKIEMEAIKDALCAADPDNSTVFQSNYEKYAAELDALDKEYSDTLSPLPNRTIVVAHEAFGYLCDAYGLTQVGIEGLSPTPSRTPAAWRRSSTSSVNTASRPSSSRSWSRPRSPRPSRPRPAHRQRCSVRSRDFPMSRPLPEPIIFRSCTTTLPH